MARRLQENLVPSRFPGQERAQESVRQPWLAVLRFSVHEAQLPVKHIEDGSFYVPMRMRRERRGGFGGQLLGVVLQPLAHDGRVDGRPCIPGRPDEGRNGVVVRRLLADRVSRMPLQLLELQLVPVLKDPNERLWAGLSTAPWPLGAG